MTAGAGFHVDPVRLRSASPQFDAAADQLEDARTTLEAALAAEGPCWGGDDAGQTFARTYLPQAEATTRAVGSIVAALRAVRVGLDTSADTWEGCDQGAAGRLGARGGRQR
ncbi:MAG: WXG100 family type VII secretion target [Actinomycetota bacterium]|nr:WXG100 family type VII secretion target [Actinomycetota bacterium]